MTTLCTSSAAGLLRIRMMVVWDAGYTFDGVSLGVAERDCFPGACNILGLE